jgi:hypothetical protein
VIVAFGRARAVNAVVCALAMDDVAAAREAVYEAHAALTEREGHSLLQHARDILRETA